MTTATPREKSARPADVLVVGGSAAGLSTVEALRRRGFAGPVTVLGDEAHPPYDRPPLSKQVLSGAWEPERTWLRSAEALGALDATFAQGRAASLDIERRAVLTETGEEHRADAVVVATGARAHKFAWQDGVRGIHTLRTLDDALALRDDFPACSRLVVVGEGVLGAEIAATARAAGLAVTMTGPQPAPMYAQLGSPVSDRLGRLHLERGVDLRLGASVVGVSEAFGTVSGVRLSTGETIAADLVVVAVGGRPATEWLLDSGLTLEDGLVCDEMCRAAEGIYGVGDVARWLDPRTGRHQRLENRTNATEQALAVASTIAGDPTPYEPVPYFWTDQYDVKVQVFGTVTAAAEPAVVDGDLESNRFVVRYVEHGTTVAVVGWNMPKQARQRRQEIVDGAERRGATP